MSLLPQLERVLTSTPETCILTGVQHIPELALAIDLPPNQQYTIAEVGDVRMARNALIRSLDLNLDDFPGAHEVVSGSCLALNHGTENAPQQLVVLHIQSDLYYPRKCMVRGHEFGHMLSTFGLQSLIYARFTRPDIVEQYMRDEEDFASLCGYYVLHLMGVNLEGITETSPNPSEVLAHARARHIVHQYVKR